jgi:light-regulated signal transduction histidine kinase (bacteriophytochrome)
MWIYNPHPDFDTNSVIGKIDPELDDHEGTKRLYKAKLQVIQTGIGMQTELSFPISGGLRSYDFAIEPRYNTAGQVIGTTTSAYDITERKKTEEELRRSNAELEQFAYVASHDLQEPLRAIAGMVQLLSQRYKGKLDARADEYIHHAVEASTRMQALINDLLDYSRVERFGKSLSPTNAERALNLALKNLQMLIEENHADITYDPMPMVMADSVQLIQVFQNLIGNALKFHSEQPPRIHIGAEKVAHDWRFSVRDNGIGIDPQYFERIFLVFQRLHTRRESPGTGIGLSLCKKIVERHGGQIWVEAELGQGATFYFTIPEMKP